MWSRTLWVMVCTAIFSLALSHPANAKKSRANDSVMVSFDIDDGIQNERRPTRIHMGNALWTGSGQMKFVQGTYTLQIEYKEVDLGVTPVYLVDIDLSEYKKNQLGFVIYRQPRQSCHINWINRYLGSISSQQELDQRIKRYHLSNNNIRLNDFMELQAMSQTCRASRNKKFRNAGEWALKLVEKLNDSGNNGIAVIKIR